MLDLFSVLKKKEKANFFPGLYFKNKKDKSLLSYPNILKKYSLKEIVLPHPKFEKKLIKLNPSYYYNIIIDGVKFHKL